MMGTSGGAPHGLSATGPRRKGGNKSCMFLICILVYFFNQTTCCVCGERSRSPGPVLRKRDYLLLFFVLSPLVYSPHHLLFGLVSSGWRRDEAEHKCSRGESGLRAKRLADGSCLVLSCFSGSQSPHMLASEWCGTGYMHLESLVASIRRLYWGGGPRDTPHLQSLFLSAFESTFPRGPKLVDAYGREDQLLVCSEGRDDDRREDGVFDGPRLAPLGHGLRRLPIEHITLAIIQDGAHCTRHTTECLGGEWG